MWKFVGTRVTKGESGAVVREPVEPIPGIGGDPMDDDDFEERVARYEVRFGDEARGSVERSGLYVHEKGRVRPEQPAIAPAGEEA